MLKSIKILFMTAGIIVLSACSPFPKNDVVQIPQGEMEITGTLEPLELNLYQLGTHQIRTEGGEVIALQSRLHNLSEYVNQEVTVKGVVEVSKIDDTKWVLAVGSIKAQGFTGDTLEFQSNALGLRFNYSSAWTSSEGSDGVTLKGDAGTVLTIEKYESESVSEFANAKEDTEGTPVTVATQSALRFTDTDQIRLYFGNASGKAVYRLTYYESADDADQKTAFYDLLQSLQLVYYQQVTGAPCAGPDNLKCPENFRCELSSNEPGAEGICVDLSGNIQALACPIITPPTNCVDYKPRSFNAASCPTGYECLDKKTEATPSITQATYDDMRTYENERRGYTIQYHRNWYYASFGAVEGSIWTLGFSDQALESPEEALILVEEHKGDVSSAKVTSDASVYSVQVQGSNGSYFVIKGALDQEELIDRMASTLTFTP